MLFTIHAEKSAQDKTFFLYDNQTNVLKREDGTEYRFPDGEQKHEHGL